MTACESSAARRPPAGQLSEASERSIHREQSELSVFSGGSVAELPPPADEVTVGVFVRVFSIGL